jgi:hypothetical protein
MDLNSYLKRPGAPTVAEFRALLAAYGWIVNSDAQIRQLQHGYQGRLPATETCVVIEKATKKAVMRWDLRPDWFKHWPELITWKNAPPIPERESA